MWISEDQWRRRTKNNLEKTSAIKNRCGMCSSSGTDGLVERLLAALSSLSNVSCASHNFTIYCVIF